MLKFGFTVCNRITLNSNWSFISYSNQFVFACKMKAYQTKTVWFFKQKMAIIETKKERGRERVEVLHWLGSGQIKSVHKDLKSFTSQPDNRRGCLWFISTFFHFCLFIIHSRRVYKEACSQLKCWADSINYWSSSIAITGHTSSICPSHTGMTLYLCHTHVAAVLLMSECCDLIDHSTTGSNVWLSMDGSVIEEKGTSGKVLLCQNIGSKINQVGLEMEGLWSRSFTKRLTFSKVLMASKHLQTVGLLNHSFFFVLNTPYLSFGCGCGVHVGKNSKQYF